MEGIGKWRDSGVIMLVTEKRRGVLRSRPIQNNGGRCSSVVADEWGGGVTREGPPPSRPLSSHHFSPSSLPRPLDYFLNLYLTVRGEDKWGRASTNKLPRLLIHQTHSHHTQSTPHISPYPPNPPLHSTPHNPVPANSPDSSFTKLTPTTPNPLHTSPNIHQIHHSIPLHTPMHSATHFPPQYPSPSPTFIHTSQHSVTPPHSPQPTIHSPLVSNQPQQFLLIPFLFPT
ncbi:hypothetical protein Pcinc_011261 [Petrolisthes cinctipes]|uniref:Uncharacterized protein n=1 Tax=Petrolisthes cinctipes TaxID=88211 RepID=A0AAE1G162_PETCI|nr:hypothetical protein Pcinc_011261 [Petrolisthes cinctipes]